MIASIIRACVTHRIMVLLLAALLAVGGTWSARRIAVDAIPDLSDVQVIVRTDFAGQAPQIVQDQVTYPMTTAMLAVPGAEVVRGYSMFGSSFVYVLFADGTDLYWARSRVLEQLASLTPRLPADARPSLGPDATAVGWVFQYVLLTDPVCPEHGAVAATPDGRCPIGSAPLVEPDVGLADLRSLQDFYLGPELTAVEGVAEVAAIGGFTRQYQVVVDPNRLRAFGISLAAVREAIRRSNADTGGRLIERGETEFMVRGRGYLGGVDSGGDSGGDSGAGDSADTGRAVVADLERVALGANADGAPILLKDVADVAIGPDIRRGVAEWSGTGETVGGIVLMRFGENAWTTIERVRERLDELGRGLPPGVRIAIAYDRSDLIERAIHTVSETLVEEIVVVSLVILVFLMHVRSALVAACVLPLGVLATLAFMHATGINANIMSLGGIAISIGVMVDSAVVMVENGHRRLSEPGVAGNTGADAARPKAAVVADAAAEVGPTLFFSLLIILVAFLPIFVLDGQAGRLFKPLAITKSVAMGAAAVLAVTLIPALMVFCLPRGRSSASPARSDRAVTAVDRFLQRLYDPAFAAAMRRPWLTLGLAGLALLTVLYPWSRLGSEFMPPLEEGDLLYMPTTDPGISLAKATQLLQQTDRVIASFPEVATVFGKIGRADTATDPAPVSMLETTITLHRDPDRWRRRPVARFYHGWPRWLAAPLRALFPDTRVITTDELIYGYELPPGFVDSRPAGMPPGRVPGLNDALQIPGLANAWTLPIRTRIDMLSTGIRTPVGLKFMGDDLAVLADLSEQAATILGTDPRTRDAVTTAFADKAVGGSYLDIDIDRAAIARYGLTVGDVQDVIMTAVGGMTVTATVEGLERYPVNLRYPRELRDTPDKLEAILVDVPDAGPVPLGQLAEVVTRRGPPMIKSENARLTSWVYVDLHTTDLGGFVDTAKSVLADRLPLPAGVTLAWSGQYTNLAAARERLTVAIPLAGVAILLLLYAATRSWARVGIVLLAVPFSMIGAFWLTWWLGFELSLAVWVGVIALLGLDAETGLVMLLYLDRAVKRRNPQTRDGVLDAIHAGAVRRIRPKTMTVLTTFIGLLPLLWADGAGADTMRRLAAPMIGGLATSFIAELLLYPVIFRLMHQRPGPPSRPVPKAPGEDVPGDVHPEPSAPGGLSG